MPDLRTDSGQNTTGTIESDPAGGKSVRGVVDVGVETLEIASNSDRARIVTLLDRNDVPYEPLCGYSAEESDWPNEESRIVPTLKFRAKRAAVVIVATASLLGLAGCRMGFESATLNQYTQAEGVNVDLADGGPVDQGRGQVKVRNLLIIAQPGSEQARLAGVIYGAPSSDPAKVLDGSPTVDTLQSVTGRVLETDGAAGPALTVSLPEPLPVVVQAPVRLEDQDITVTGATLVPGVDVELTLTFGENGTVTTRVPVVDGTKADYATMTPVAVPEAEAATASPAPNGSPTANPSPTATPAN